MAEIKILEKTLEDILMNTDRDKLCGAGIRVPLFKKRQVNIGNYGIADMVGVDWEAGQLIVTVFELKQDRIDAGTLLQGMKYIKGVSRYFSTKREWLRDIRYELVLVGRDIDTRSDFIYLPDFINGYDNGSLSLSLFTYSYDFDGINFQNHVGYKLKNEGFKHG